MFFFVFGLFLLQADQGTSLSQNLLKQLEAGDTQFRAVEMALIAGGSDTQADLTAQMAKLEPFLARLTLSDKQKSQSADKQAKALVKALGKALKKQEKTATIQDGLEKGSYNPTTASFFLDHAFEKAGLSGNTWPKKAAPAADFFKDRAEKRSHAILASLWAQRAETLLKSDPTQAARCLQISRLLDARPLFEADRLEREWYNHTYKLYQDKSLIPGSELAYASATRFPKLEQFKAVCYNFGILLAQDKSIDFAQKAPLIRNLIPLTGEHQDTLDGTYQALGFNRAVTFYQEGDFEKAWDMAQTITKSPDAGALKNLKGASLEGVIESKVKAGKDVSADLQTLKGIDGERWQLLETRLKQLAVKNQFEKGNLNEALALAEQQLDTDQGKQNYLAVLQKLVSQMVDGKQYEAVLKKLAGISADKASPQDLAGYKFNTYVAWLNDIQNPKDQFPVYASLFADKSLNLSDQERSAMMDGWGNAYYQTIEKMIADRDFKGAQTLSGKALKTVPNHKALLKQKDLIKTIMARTNN